MKRVRLSPSRRRGIVLLAVLAALTVVTTVLVGIGWHLALNRRVADHRREQIQAEWLARSGVEIAVERLLSRGEGYTGESVKPLDKAEIVIVVEAVKDKKDLFHIKSEAHYPAQTKFGVVRHAGRTVRRVIEGKKVRIEVVGSDPQK